MIATESASNTMAHNDMDVSAQSRKVALVLAESMRSARAQRQWTQADVAERAGTTQDRISQIETGAADVVFGSRLMGKSPIEQGMPWWKYYGNRLLTTLENKILGLELSEYHTGYRAFSRKVLEEINFHANSDGFIFDQEVVMQIADAEFRIAEVAVPTRYFPEASSASFVDSVNYGCGILWLVFRYLLHKNNVLRQTKFQSLQRRYKRIEVSAS